MEVEQPYENHNAGQILFGQDKMLYISWGDGGWMNDPARNGQNLKTFLGSMLRIDVDSPPDSGKAYKVPEDNPFMRISAVNRRLTLLGLEIPGDLVLI